MGKSIKANDDNRTHKKIRSNTAFGMIASGTGVAQIFQDRRSKRSKDRKNSWQHDQEENG